MNLARHSIVAVAGIFLVLPGIVFGASSVRQDQGLPELPDWGSVRTQLRQYDAPIVPEPVLFGLGRSAAPAPAQPLLPAPQLPQEFTMKENFFSSLIGWDTFSMWDLTGKKIGHVREQVISLTKAFTYSDENGNTIAEARERFFSWGSTADVTDSRGTMIGTIKEDIWKSLFKVYTLYHILDANGKEIATSEKVEILSTELVLRDGTGRVVAEIRRGFLNSIVTDHWGIKIHDANAVDPRLIVVIAAFKTGADNDRQRAHSDDDDDKDKDHDKDHDNNDDDNRDNNDEN